MVDTHQRFTYPRSERLTRVGLFLLALLLPLLILILGFIFLISFPPYHPINKELFVRLLRFYPDFAAKNSVWMLILCNSMWGLVVAVHLPNAITFSLVIDLDDDRITATLYGFHWQSLQWREVERVETFTIQDYDGIVWHKVRAIRLLSRIGRIKVREPISEFAQFVDRIVSRGKALGIPIVTK